MTDHHLQICRSTDLNLVVKSGVKFGVIYADPPWRFEVYSEAGKSRSAERHYETMGPDVLLTMAKTVGDLAASDCALFMWAVMPQLPEALRLIDAWGFTYKTVGFTWVKTVQSKPNTPAIGMGYWTRANPELCLLATRGSPKRQHMDVEELVVAPRGRHSEKPEIVAERIERLVPGPYLEMFARRERRGWTVWGNEIERTLFDSAHG